MAGTGGGRDWSCLTPLRLAERVLDANCSGAGRPRGSSSMRFGGPQRACEPAEQVVRRSSQAEPTHQSDRGAVRELRGRRHVRLLNFPGATRCVYLSITSRRKPGQGFSKKPT